MAGPNVPITPGTGLVVLADGVVDASLGDIAAQVQYIKVLDGTVGSVNKQVVNSSGQSLTLAEPVPLTLTAIAPTSFSVVTGGTAVQAFAGNTIKTLGVIINPNEATESLYIDLINAPGTTAPGTHGTTVEITAGTTFTVPGPLTNSVQVNAATNGHVFTAYSY